MGFKWSTLGELSIGGGKYGISAPAVEFDRNLPAYLRITDINDDGSLNLSDRKSVADPLAFDYMLQEGDIVFARTGSSTGRNYYYDLRDGDFAFAGFLIKFSLDKEKVNPRFIKYYVQSKPYWDWVSSFNTGSTRGNINAKTYAQMPVPLPDRDVQDAIVCLCDSLSNKIRINNRLNDYLTDLATALFEKALDEETCLIPFGELAELEDSKRIPLNKQDRENRKGPYPYYGATSIMDYVDDYLFDDIRVLLGEDGSVMTDEGHPFLQYVWGKYWVNNHAHIIKAKSDYSLEALYLALRRTVINHIVTGAVQMKISQKNLNGLELQMPNLTTITDFGPFFAMYRHNADEAKRLAELRDILLPKMMSGEIDVSKISIH
ncbi:MAG: restriction endonuclease subunit S [Collinsella sp.]|nr:restriction endonuclease subunit S [Collinsella sp.]